MSNPIVASDGWTCDELKESTRRIIEKIPNALLKKKANYLEKADRCEHGFATSSEHAPFKTSKLKQIVLSR